MTIINRIKFDEVIDFLIKKDFIISVYIYGSILTQNFRKDSDVDIALLISPDFNLNSIEKLKLASRLSLLIHREVHLGLLSNHSLIYSKEVLSKGYLLFTKDSFQNDMFRSTAYSMYFELKRNLREVYNEYRA